MNQLQRIEKYIAERKKGRGIDIEEIHGMHVGHEREAILLLSDIEWLVARAKEGLASEDSGEA